MDKNEELISRHKDFLIEIISAQEELSLEIKELFSDLQHMMASILELDAMLLRFRLKDFEVLNKHVIDELPCRKEH